MLLDKIEVVSDYKHLQIREITDEGKYHRRILSSNQTLAEDEHQEVKDKAKEVWTDEVKQKWIQFLEEQETRRLERSGGSSE